MGTPTTKMPFNLRVHPPVTADQRMADDPFGVERTSQEENGYSYNQDATLTVRSTHQCFGSLHAFC